MLPKALPVITGIFQLKAIQKTGSRSPALRSSTVSGLNIYCFRCASAPTQSVHSFERAGGDTTKCDPPFLAITLIPAKTIRIENRGLCRSS